MINSTIDEVDDILDGPADEVDHARALQSDIEYYEKLDDLLGVAIARRDDVLAQIDFYRQGLGQRLRRVSDEIIDAEFKETRHRRSPALTVMRNDVCQKGGGQPDNGRKSRGPRTGAGKARASRNARRHGLAAFNSKDDPAMTEQIAQMVDAICAGDDDPLLRQQAVMIAENQLWLSCVKAEKVARY